MNLSKILKSAVKKAKDNPELALVAVGLVAPGLARKAAPVIDVVKRKP